MMAQRASEVDLFDWPELKAARERAEAAEAVWAEARRRALHAPHGEVLSRQAAVKQAAKEALMAALELEKLQREKAH